MATPDKLCSVLEVVLSNENPQLYNYLDKDDKFKLYIKLASTVISFSLALKSISESLLLLAHTY